MASPELHVKAQVRMTLQRANLLDVLANSANSASDKIAALEEKHQNRTFILRGIASFTHRKELFSAREHLNSVIHQAVEVGEEISAIEGMSASVGFVVGPNHRGPGAESYHIFGEINGARVKLAERGMRNNAGDVVMHGSIDKKSVNACQPLAREMFRVFPKLILERDRLVAELTP